MNFNIHLREAINSIKYPSPPPPPKKSLGLQDKYRSQSPSQAGHSNLIPGPSPLPSLKGKLIQALEKAGYNMGMISAGEFTGDLLEKLGFDIQQLRKRGIITHGAHHYKIVEATTFRKGRSMAKKLRFPETPADDITLNMPKGRVDDSSAGWSDEDGVPYIQPEQEYNMEAYDDREIPPEAGTASMDVLGGKRHWPEELPHNSKTLSTGHDPMPKRGWRKHPPHDDYGFLDEE